MTIQLRKPLVKKLPHEKLQEWAINRSPLTAATSDYVIDIFSSLSMKSSDLLKAIADEIKEYYRPIPRDHKGNPVHEGMEVDGGTVHAWCVYDDGSWDLYNEDYELIQSGGFCDPIRLPKPDVLDADGVPCKSGERVWYAPGYITKDNKGPWKVLDIQGSDSVLIGRGYIPGEDDYMETVSGEAPDILTHREPDSLEKLRDDIAEFSADGAYHGAIDAFLQRCEDRLTAIMERDA